MAVSDVWRLVHMIGEEHHLASEAMSVFDTCAQNELCYVVNVSWTSHLWVDWSVLPNSRTHANQCTRNHLGSTPIRHESILLRTYIPIQQRSIDGMNYGIVWRRISAGHSCLVRGTWCWVSLASSHFSARIRSNRLNICLSVATNYVHRCAHISSYV